MFKEIQIGANNVPMLCLASTNIYYNKVFGVDPIALQASGKLTPADGIDFSIKLAFIMAKQAEFQSDRAAMLRLNEGDFIDWLNGFEADALYDALESVMELYRGDGKVTSKAKK